MTFIKFLMALTLMFVMTFHSIAPANESTENNDDLIYEAVNNWCEGKISMIFTTLQTVQYCRSIQESCSGSKEHCDEVILNADKDDMVELTHYTIQYMDKHIIQ